MTKTTLGMDERLEGLFAYALGWVSGFLILLFEKESRFVRFHAFQSLYTFLILFIFILLPVVGKLLAPILVPLSIFLWIFLMFQAYHGRRFKVPLVGEYAAKELE